MEGGQNIHFISPHLFVTLKGDNNEKLICCQIVIFFFKHKAFYAT